MPHAALEFTLAEPDDRAVRQIWEALIEAGLPSQGRHRGASNAPHVTIAARPEIPVAMREAAVDHIAAHLPAELGVDGQITFTGRRRSVVALGVRLPEVLRRDVEAFRDAWELPQPWTAHITIARHVGADELAAVSEVVTRGPLPTHLRVGALRYWDPVTATTTQIGAPT